ncbi:MAG: hypothetical protein V2I79_11390 [Xanthomonadales bacterium]|jgi:hypothetical protein|nr:hypothetical protein [Xanthomonadales bacterium]
MNKTTVFVAACFLILGASSAVAGEEPEIVKEEKIVIALETDEFSIAETDLSHLEVGDAETILTESGKTVDLLRTENGIEIYVDGELLDMPGMHEEHHVVHEIKIICDDGEEDCAEDMTWITESGDVDFEALHDGEHKVIIMHGDDVDYDVEVLGDGPHEAHGTVHIVREFEDVDVDDLHEAHNREVIIIKKKVEDEI